MAKDKEKILEELTRVKFVGPHVAEQLYATLEVRSLEDLIEVGRAGKITSISGIGEKTQKTIISSAERQLANKNKASTPVASVKKPAPKKSEPAAKKPEVKKSEPAAKKPEGKKSEPVAKKPEVKKAVDIVAKPADGKKATKTSKPKIVVGLKEDKESAVSNISKPVGKSLSERFLDTLRCPACGHDTFETGEGTVTCMACQRQFSAQHGIVDLAPPHVPERSLTQRIMELRFYAQFYEDVMRPKLTSVVSDRTMREEFRLAADFLELDENTRLLDVAAGTSNFTRYFAERLGLSESNGPAKKKQPLVVAMDLSWPMLETARGYLRREGLDERVFLLRGDATRIPIKRGSYNRLHCSAGLHLMSDIDEALRNFARVLEPGGICVVGTFILGEGLMRRFIKRAAEIPTKFHWFSREELHHRMERAGFEILDESVSGDAITIKARRI